MPTLSKAKKYCSALLRRRWRLLCPADHSSNKVVVLVSVHMACCWLWMRRLVAVASSRH